MLSDTIVGTSGSSTSTYPGIDLRDTSAKQYITVFADDQENHFDWSRILDITALSLRIPRPLYSESYLTMLASENVLRRDWDQPEEDEAWANL